MAHTYDPVPSSEKDCNHENKIHTTSRGVHWICADCGEEGGYSPVVKTVIISNINNDSH